MNTIRLTPTILQWFFFLSLALIVVEMVWSLIEDRGVYHFKETLCNLSILALRRLSQSGFAVISIVPMQALHSLALFKIPDTGWTMLAAIIVMDFLYYWEHRLSHQVPILWAFHEVHHSSPWFNLSTSYRLNLLDRILAPVLLTPALLLGFSTKQILFAFGINLSYQFFMHTQSVAKLGFIEGTINTPSAHRVHHGSNPRYLDKNFGGIFMIWDRLFGTYEPEAEPVVYGTTKGFIGHNPIRVLLNGFALLFRRTSTTVITTKTAYLSEAVTF